MIKILEVGEELVLSDADCSQHEIFTDEGLPLS